MEFKRFCAEHRPLIESLFWTFMTVMVILFWPRSADMANPPESTILRVEVPVIVSPEPPEVVTSSPPPMEELDPSPEIVKLPRYGFTDDDIYLMATLLTGSKYVDGDGEFDFDYGREDEYDQISLVLCVVMNMVRSELFPDTVSGVIWKKNAFSPMPQWKDKLPQVSDISLKLVTEWCNAYDSYDPGVQTIPEDHLYFSGDGVNNHSRSNYNGR